MKKSKFTDSQIINILKANEAGAKVSDLCREHGMSQATFYKWRSKFGGMDVSMMKRIKQLELEKDTLKQASILLGSGNLKKVLTVKRLANKHSV